MRAETNDENREIRTVEAPRRSLYFDVVVRLVWPNDPES